MPTSAGSRRAQACRRHSRHANSGATSGEGRLVGDMLGDERREVDVTPETRGARRASSDLLDRQREPQRRHAAVRRCRACVIARMRPHPKMGRQVRKLAIPLLRKSKHI